MAKDHWAKDNAEALMIAPSGEQTTLLSGGPDSYGYYFYDSQDSASNAPTYHWIDISGIGDSVNFQQDDQNLGTFLIGFPFYFYGQLGSWFRVCSNGWLSFSSYSTAYLNRPIPTGDDPNSLLAVFWDDLMPGSGMAYRYSNNHDTCIVSWNHFQRYPGGGDYTFEVIMTADGNIVFQYQAVSGVLNSHTIAIENSNGTAGLQYVFNNNEDESGTAIYFGLRPPHYASHDVMPSSFRSPPARGVAGSAFTPMVRYTNAGSFNESFDGRIRIFHNGQLYDQIRRVNTLRPDSSSLIPYPAFAPTETGAYELVAISELTTDQFQSNDTCRLSYYAFNSILTVNFEANPGSFLGNHDWEWGTATRGPGSAHSGTKLWGTILNGNYSVGPLLSTLYSDTLFLGDTTSMTFWGWYDTEALFDGGNVKISTDDGATWTILTPAGGYDGILSSSFENPLGGQPAFFGNSGGWQMESFDLSAYTGTTAIIRFDFGSDNSTVYTGWYIDDFQVLGGGAASPGWLKGSVRDTLANPIAQALVSAGRRSNHANSLGRYILEMLPGTYPVTASAQYYNAVTSSGVTVAAGDTTTLDFMLTTPQLEVDTSAIDTALVQGEVLTVTRQLMNSGNGPLDFNIRVDLARRDRLLDKAGGSPDPPRIANFGDEVFTFDPQTPTNDDGCVGVEFDGSHFWVTGRHGVDEFHKLHKFDRDGNLIASYNQNTHSLWGWRDLAFDGRYLYASDENELAVIDTATGLKVDTLHMPGSIPAPLRALAYDPSSGHFWAANFLSNIIEFTRTGETINSFANNRYVFGLAWDNVSRDGPWLWVFSQEDSMEVSQFDPRTGQYTGVTFAVIDHNGGEPDLVGGACFTTEWDQSKGVLFCLVMGRYGLFDSIDNVQGYEITPFARWLTVTPSAGTIEPQSSREISIRIDFSDTLFASDSLFRGAVTIENISAYVPTIPVDVGFQSGIGDGNMAIPNEFGLSQNYPNPFNAQTVISYSLPKASDVTIDIFDLLGRKIYTLAEGKMPAGEHKVIWDASRQSSGIYFYRIKAGDKIETRKMVLIK